MLLYYGVHKYFKNVQNDYVPLYILNKKEFFPFRKKKFVKNFISLFEKLKIFFNINNCLFMNFRILLFIVFY